MSVCANADAAKARAGIRTERKRETLAREPREADRVEEVRDEVI
jgi:hypothetical protein